jgi:glycosyltransferase involved in cell wall biosynthesis
MARFTFISTMAWVPWGGSEDLWSGAVLRLLNDGHRVSVSVVGWETDPPAIAQLEYRGALVHRRPRRPSWLKRAAFAAVGVTLDGYEADWLYSTKPDLVVISQGDALSGLSYMEACCRKNLRFANVCQANWEGFWPDDRDADRARRAYEEAACSFFVSQSNLDLLCTQLASSIPRATVVCNPFKVPYTPASPLLDDPDPLRVACVARLDARAKGQDLLLNAISRSRWRERAIEVHFYGEGSNASSLRRLAERLELRNAYFHGHVADVEAIWARNHLLALTSRFEGTPLALIEAMLCSRSAVVTDVGGNGELVQDGVSGFIASAPTTDMVEHAMEQAWSQRHAWRELGASARARALKRVPQDPVGVFVKHILQLT